ncbi:hypothetical protein AAHA92_12408 [Salvia divinorum]|uniref:Tify domain-containing protein n=1 Tax=Salvia divinorum TaxID=28513 RepID=A0ABD1HNS7_SALDI
MSFQNNIIWLPNGSGSVANGEICYNTSSRIDQKRPHQWFMDSSEQEFIVSKKQAVEPFKGTLGPVGLESSLWHDGSHLQSENLPPSLFTPKPVRTSDVSDNNITPVTSMNMERKDLGLQFGNDSSVCLTMSRAVNDSLCMNSGPRKVKVNEWEMLFQWIRLTYYNGIDNNVLSTGRAFNRGNYNINVLGEQYEKENGNFSSVCPTYNRGQENLYGLEPFYRKVNETGEMHIAFQGQRDAAVSSLGALYNKENSSILSMAEHSRKVFRRIGAKRFYRSANLLSTGILDGIPVKYVSWSREKNLRGVVKGTGYLCSCQDCKLSKAINAYEFERHAGCKTKHPNNHIYFENGKTIYAVVQELKSTPQERLFDVMQNVTGSAVNQKNFNTWKASYQAATRELQRIYGKDDLVAPS